MSSTKNITSTHKLMQLVLQKLQYILFNTANTVQDFLKSLISNLENCLQVNFS